MSDKKAHILDVVLSFLAHPTSKRPLSIANVAKATGMAKSSIYEHFTNKQSLVHAALCRLIDRNENTLINVEGFSDMSFSAAFSEHMHRFLELSSNNEMMHNYMHHPLVQSMSESLKADLKSRVNDLTDTVHLRFKTILQKGIDEGVLNETVSHKRLQTVESLVLGNVVALSMPHNDWDVDATVEDVLNSIIILYNH